MASSTVASARIRLLEDLKAGVNCAKADWEYETKDWITCIDSADINLDGDIEVLAGSHSGRVYSLDRKGKPNWEKVMGEKEWVTAVAACSPLPDQSEACIIACTRLGRIYILDQAGKIIRPPNAEEKGPDYWFDTHQAIIQVKLEVSPESMLITFASEDLFVYRFDVLHNCLLWTFSPKAPIHSLYLSDIDHDGQMETLVGSDNQILYLLSSTGELRGQRLMEQAIHAVFAADIDHDRQVEILVGTRSKKLFVLNARLEERWSTKLTSRPMAIAAVDVNNDAQPEVLVSCDDQSLAIFENTGQPVWRHKWDKRFHCLNTCDLDIDGHNEVLAGTDDSRVMALRIQLNKDLDKRIRRNYLNLGKPAVTSLTELNNDQLNLLLAVLGTTYGAIDKKLNLTAIYELIETSEYKQALLSLLKLSRQRFQLQWEKSQLGYRRGLCLADLSGDKRRMVVVSSQTGGLAAFNAHGRPLWSEPSPDKSDVFDVQSGYLFAEHSENLAFVSEAGTLTVVGADKARTNKLLQFPEKVSCFYALAPGKQRASDMLLGTKDGKMYLYTNTFEKASRVFEVPSAIQRVYASEPDENGKYRSPEILISTAENVLFAYTRGGNFLWKYATRSRILALCVKDLDGDGRLEVLIGSEDRNIYVLDDNGILRWRYVLYNMVMAVEVADLDGDGKQEILVGCGDGILYVFTSIGDLIWRYASRDPIQALRAADIDLDGNVEIVMAEEGHLEVLQIVRQQELDTLMAICWEQIFAQATDSLEALLALIKGNDPDLRAAALLKLAQLRPLPSEAFDLFNEALKDAFPEVRKTLAEALMYAYSAHPTRARVLLNLLYTEKLREVRIEVIEHLEILARYDWPTVISYLERALRSKERNTRRAALRKIAQLLREFSDEVKQSQHSLAESLFKLLLTAAQDSESLWIKEEMGRVLADFLNLFEADFLLYALRMFAHRLVYDTFQHAASNMKAPLLRQVMNHLSSLKFSLPNIDVADTLAQTVRALEKLQGPVYGYSTDLWLIFSELREVFALTSPEKMAAYELHLKPEQFQITTLPYPHAQTFLHVAEQFTSITNPFKAFLRRSDPNDRLSLLQESIDALGALQRLVDREYGVSPLPIDPQPYQPEFGVLQALIRSWQDLFTAQRNELRGHPELQCYLQRTVHYEETVGVWLRITNQGRASARQVKVTLLSNRSFTSERPAQPKVVELAAILPNQDSGAEFVIKPQTDTVTLTFEIAYIDAEHALNTLVYQDRLDFIERPHTFVPIKNPYTTGTPLHTSEMCFGRDEPLAYLYDNLTRTTTQTILVLYGQRRSGKTTLLNQLAKTDMLSPHITVLIDMQSMTYGFELGKFFFKIAHRVYKAMLQKNLSLPAPRQEDFIAPGMDPLFAFELFLDDVEQALNDRLLVLLFDEFEVLEDLVKEELLEPAIFEYLRSLMQARPYIHFLMSGTKQIEKLTRNYWSVFFNIALHHKLASSISHEGAIELITRPVTGALEYEPQVVNKIRALTADQPYMIHLVCRALIDHCNNMRKNYATLNDVNLVRKKVLETGTIHFDWLWERFKPEEQLILQALAQGTTDEFNALYRDDIGRILERFGYPYDPAKVTLSLKTLWEEDVVEGRSETRNKEPQQANQEETRYSLVHGLLRQWLKENRPLVRAQDASEESEAQEVTHSSSSKELIRSRKSLSNGNYDPIRDVPSQDIR